MQEWFKGGNKKFRHFCLILFIFVFLFIPIQLVKALDNCKGTMTVDEVPCYILLQFNISNLDCSDYSVSVYNESTFLYTQTLANYSPFMCNATFNYSSPSTYNGQYSTGDTFDIIVEEGYVRFYVYISLFIILFLLLIMGHLLEQPVMQLLAGMLAPVMAIDIFINGFPSVNNAFLTNSVAIILTGLGFYYLILPSLNFIMEWNA